MNTRQLFLQHVGQTSPAPLALHITKASGCKMWDVDGKEYLDLIAGISVCNVGHSHPNVVQAIKEQAEKYLHIMVYGELVETPQVAYAKAITDLLPPTLNSVFYTASGSEATEGAMKLAKRVTNRSQIISFKNSYHGSTQGALSVMGSEYWQQAYRPLLPNVLQLRHNVMEDLEHITLDIACVIAETIQAEAGVLKPSVEWMQALRKKCTDTCTLLILDEIQCGFGRNGTMFAFEQFGIVPDVLLLGKALGAGMPLGAFVADKKLMDTLSYSPILGHINTFGGHPVSCAAGLAGLQVLLQQNVVADVCNKEAAFRKLLEQHPKIKNINSVGLMMAVYFDDFDTNKKIIDTLIENGVFTDWFLFCSEAMRICPPLNITYNEIEKACEIIIDVLDNKI
jgi:acetylornithine/N-succinyldiaminopimelate aminotransferase